MLRQFFSRLHRRISRRSPLTSDPYRLLATRPDPLLPQLVLSGNLISGVWGSADHHGITAQYSLVANRGGPPRNLAYELGPPATPFRTAFPPGMERSKPRARIAIFRGLHDGRPALRNRGFGGVLDEQARIGLFGERARPAAIGNCIARVILGNRAARSVRRPFGLAAETRASHADQLADSSK
jgi:hypothetical protein